MEQPLRPGGHARQDEETDQDEQKSLENRQDQTKYPEKDEAPTDDVNRDALEFRLRAHNDNNESLADAVQASTEWRVVSQFALGNLAGQAYTNRSPTK